MKIFMDKLLQLDIKKICVLIFLVALLPRFVWFFVKGRYLDITIPAGGDAIGYDKIAVNLVKYHQYAVEPGKPTAYREPVYPYFLAGIYLIFGLSNYTAVRIIQILISSLTCVMIFLLAYKMFDKKVAILAGIISCFWPHFIYYSTTILRETLFCFLLICTVYFLNNIYKEKVNLLNLIITGILSGLVSLLNTTSLIFLFFSFFVLFVVKKVKEVIIVICLFILIYSFWVVRNYKVFNTIILGSTVGGMTLYGASVGDYKIFGTPEEKFYWEKDPVMQQAKIMDEIQSYKFFLHHAKNIIISNPKEYLIKCVKRFLKLYRIYPHRGKGYAHSESLIVWVNILSYGILLPFFIYSFFSHIKEFSKYVFLYLIIITFSLTYTLIWAVIRYRLPLEPYMIIFASGFLYKNQR